MVVRVVLLFAAFVVVRIALVRSTGKALVANLGATAVVIAYVIGLLGHGLPQFERYALEPADSGPDASAAHRNSPHDASSACRTAKRPPSAGGVGSFDYLLDEQDRPLSLGTSVTVHRDREYFVSGWAAASDAMHPALGVCLMLDDRTLRSAPATYGIGRPDVATALKAPLLGTSGYVITIPPNALPEGRHHLAIGIVSDDGSTRIVAHGVDVSVR